MSRIIIKNAVKRKKNHLYYVDGEGNICSAKMTRRKRNWVEVLKEWLGR